MRDKDGPLAVNVPRAAEDRPSWLKVGVIAAVGFAVGVLWPRLAGVRMGPSAPGDTAPAASAPAAPRPAEGPAPSGAPAVLASTSAAPTSASAPVAASAAAPHVVVSRGAVVACKTDEGENLRGGQACGGLVGFDHIARPRLSRIKECPAAEGGSGRLSVVFALDFKGNRINFDIGKSTSVPNTEAIAACVKQSFSGVSLGAIDRDHPRYTVSYNVTLNPGEPGAAAAASGGATPAATADAPTASVVWEVAIVRDAPRTGQVIGRLQRGTRIRVGQGQDNWYRVRYGTGFSSEGWVYRGSIGR
jgi:hypothetical protein